MKAAANCLDVDIGNTRTKWRIGAQRGWEPSPELPDLSVAVERVRVSCVAGDPAALGAAISNRYGVIAEFARTTAELAGVKCAYSDPLRLGVDRWLGVVAAWSLVHGPCVVIGAGTALTLDFVDDAGGHLGGYIVPGLDTMRRALRAGTAHVDVPAVDVDACGPESLQPATDTVGAVNRGIHVMTRDFIERSVARHGQRCENTPTAFATGGDAEQAVGGLNFPVRIEPDLVLDGLCISLP